MSIADLRAECSKCCGLCCVAPAFDAAQGFGFDKPAARPCLNLRQDFSCGIHGQLRTHGFPACAGFDCYGAGQRVTELFGGRSWRSSPALASAMFDAYLRYRPLHELMAQLSTALPLAAPADRAWLQQQLDCIERLCNSGAALTTTLRPAELRAALRKRMRGSR